MRPPRTLEARIDALEAPHDEAAMPGPAVPKGRALATWGEAVAAMHVEVDDRGVDDDWRKSVAEFRAAVRDYAAILREIDEA